MLAEYEVDVTTHGTFTCIHY